MLQRCPQLGPTAGRLVLVLVMLICMAVIDSPSIAARTQGQQLGAEADAPFLYSLYSQSTSADAELANTYAPVMYLKSQKEPCDQDGDAFEPIPVDFVLGRPDIPLMTTDNGKPDGDWTLVKEAPSASDLYETDRTHFLDLPGESDDPGCTYEQDYRARIADYNHVTYAHLVNDPESGQLVL